MKLKFIIPIIIFIFLIFLQIEVTSDLPPSFTTPRTCENTWGSSCNASGVGGIDDAFGTCDGTEPGDESLHYIAEVYINASTFIFGGSVNATCEIYGDYYGMPENYYMFYYNGSAWMEITNWTDSVDDGDAATNYSAVFKVNNSFGEHRIRCSMCLNGNVYGGDDPWCADNDPCYGMTENDDANFTVTDYPKYDFWNLTNYTTGASIQDYLNLTRSDKINASAHWNKSISFAKIRHNGTGSFENYSIFSPYTGNWTNYTLDLSNATEFSESGVIEISYIWANDTYGVENYTSPAHYFNLSAGIPPNVTNFWFNYSGTTNKTNKYTNLTIYANVSDDVGLNTVIVNITYPNGNSTNATMNGSSCYLPEWCIWNYTFGNNLHLNTTGNYTIRIIAQDLGGQEKASGVDPGSPENQTFYVNNTYILNLTSNYTLYMRGENITIQALDVNNFVADNVNWIVNVTKINETYNFTPQATTFNYTIKSTDPGGNYSILVNSSKDNNTGNSSWDFNISNNFIIIISVEQTSPSTGSTLTVNANLYDIRGKHTLPVDANITCKNSNSVDRMLGLVFSNGQASSASCYAPDTYSTSFNITINVSDQYNNTGENYTILTTVSTPSTPSSPGGGGGFTLPAKEEEKKCEDETLYNQCSPERPFYCSNGTLIKYCSVCGCEPGYGCQPDESCIITKEEDFNFIINLTKIEIIQGEYEQIIFHLANTGNTILNLISFLNVSDNCCDVSIPSSFELNEKEEKEFEIKIHVPLSAKTDEHLMKIGIGTRYFKKERTINLIIKESPYYNSLSEMETNLINLEKEIQKYRKLGINTIGLETLIQQSKSLLYNANDSISTDQMDVLVNSLTNLKNNINVVHSSLTSLRTQRFLLQNSWLIILLIIMSVLTIYLVPQALVPLYKIENEIRKLKKEEEVLVSSRVATEKQYFMRKIDEKTFSNIMIRKQDSILKTRASISEKEKEAQKIIETKLKLKGILRRESKPKVFKKKDKK